MTRFKDGTPFALALSTSTSTSEKDGALVSKVTNTLYCSVVNGGTSAIFVLNLTERGKKHGTRELLVVKDSDGAPFKFSFVAGLSCLKDPNRLVGPRHSGFHCISLCVFICSAPSARTVSMLAFTVSRPSVSCLCSMVVCDAGQRKIMVLARSVQGKETFWVVTRMVGTGEAGKHDGGDAEAMFNNPHGVTEIGDDIFVADTGNHAIRRIHGGGGVSTVVGEDLNSPMDVAAGDARDGTLYIADTNNNVVKQLHLASGVVSLFAGSGQKGVCDGSWQTAAFYRPTGLATDGADCVRRGQQRAHRPGDLHGGQQGSTSTACSDSFSILASMPPSRLCSRRPSLRHV